MNTILALLCAWSFTQFDVDGAVDTIIYGINDKGHLVGAYDLATGGDHGFLLVGKKLIHIDMTGSNLTDAFGVNNSDQVVGGFGPGKAFLFKKNNLQELTLPEASAYTLARGINDINWIVGEFLNTQMHGFILVSGDDFTPVDVPGAVGPLGTSVTGANDGGQLVGYFEDSTIHGFVTHVGDEFTVLDYPGAFWTAAFGINALGQVVGAYSLDGVHGFTWNNGVFNTIDFPAADVTVTVAFGVNKSGQVAGYFIDNEGFHGFTAKTSKQSTAKKHPLPTN